MKFDSNEELYFYWWLEELTAKGLIVKWHYQPKPFVLSEPIKTSHTVLLKTKTRKQECRILAGHEYTADFLIFWAEKTEGFLHMPMIYDYGKPITSYPFISHKSKNGLFFSVVDVKGSYSQNDAWRRFSIDQKWVYQKHGIYVNKTIPHPAIDKKGRPRPVSALFVQTFVPARFMLTDKSMQSRKIKYEFLTIEQFLSKNKESLKLFSF